MIKQMFYGCLLLQLQWCFATPVHAKDSERSVIIPQVSNTPSSPERLGDVENRELIGRVEQLAPDEPDYQSKVINDPRYTELGRANAAKQGRAVAIPNAGQATSTAQAVIVTAEEMILNGDKLSSGKPGGNVVVIQQAGASSTARVAQSGTKNTSVVKQKGQVNELDIIQQGDENASYELQEGEDNRKRVIQNGKVRD